MCSLLQKQSDILLNADDLDAMWVCLRENCVIDDATSAEKVCENCRYGHTCCIYVTDTLTIGVFHAMGKFYVIVHSSWIYAMQMGKF